MCACTCVCVVCVHVRVYVCVCMHVHARVCVCMTVLCVCVCVCESEEISPLLFIGCNVLLHHRPQPPQNGHFILHRASWVSGLSSARVFPGNWATK